MSRPRRPRSTVAPFRRRPLPSQAPRPARRRRPSQRQAAIVWGLAILGLAGSYSLLAPPLDDFRSRLRPMTTACRVQAVTDGDTLDLRCPDRGGLRARIVGYDSPELFSPACAAERAAAERARDTLQTWAFHARLTEVAFLGRDRYDRALVDMRLNGERVATAMVETGNGRRYFGALRGGWC